MPEPMSLQEIVLPITKPETEWILGRAVRKVSPFRTHALLQTTMCIALAQWAKGRGEVGTEWRFRIAPPGEVRRPLVPDISYVADARLDGLEGLELELPPFAPDVAVEILAPSSRRLHLEHKIGVYLAGGSALVIVVDPPQRTVHLHDAGGVRTLRDDDVLAHDALPGFFLPLRDLFAVLERRR
jgi:Uma2 family endonuclease